MPERPPRTRPDTPLRRVIEVFKLSASDLSGMLDVSEPAARKWINGGGISEEKRDLLVKQLGFDSWGQLERFSTPHEGDIFVLRQLSLDLARVWETYLSWDASPIFETKIALSFEQPLRFGFSEEANKTARRKIISDASDALTLQRVEQPRTVRRLAELAANAFSFQRHPNYALRIVPPQPEDQLMSYPNFIRFGKKVLVLGRTHKIGAPAANNPLIMMRGDAAEELGDHLETAIWNDSNARPFSSILDEKKRIAACHEWARVLDPANGAAAFDKEYRELVSSTRKLEELRV